MMRRAGQVAHAILQKMKQATIVGVTTGELNELAQQIDRIFALQEQYPDLKASDNFLALQRDLVDIENHLQYARRFYNGAVRDLNNRIETFPSVLVARAARFRPADFYRHGAEAQQAPE